MLSVEYGEDLLPLADGKAQRSRRINLLLSSWLLVRGAAAGPVQLGGPTGGLGGLRQVSSFRSLSFVFAFIYFLLCVLK